MEPHRTESNSSGPLGITAQMGAQDPDAISPAMVDWAAFLQAPTTDWCLRFNSTPKAESAYISFRGHQRRYGLFTIALISTLAYVVGAFELSAGETWWWSLAGLSLVGSVLTAVLVAWPRPILFECLSRITGVKEYDVLFGYVSEAIALYFCATSTIGASIATSVSEDDRCRGLEHNHICHNFIFFEYMVPAMHIIRPRIVTAVPLLALQLVSAIITVYAIVPYDTLIDSLIQTFHVVLLGICAAVVFVDERADRQRFVGLVHVQHLQRGVRRRQRVIDALTTAAIPPWALAKLRSSDSIAVAMSADTTTSASIGVCDVADFAHWSTGLLPAQVVFVLHRLFSVFDAASVRFGVTKVATYADSYTVALGMPGQRVLTSEQNGGPMSLTEQQAVVETFVRWCVAGAVSSAGLRFGFSEAGSDSDENSDNDERECEAVQVQPQVPSGTAVIVDDVLKAADSGVAAAAASIADAVSFADNLHRSRRRRSSQPYHHSQDPPLQVATPRTKRAQHDTDRGPGLGGSTGTTHVSGSSHSTCSGASIFLRGAVGSGAVVGSLSGASSSLRYVLSGDAVERAREALARTAANDVTVVPRPTLKRSSSKMGSSQQTASTASSARTALPGTMSSPVPPSRPAAGGAGSAAVVEVDCEMREVVYGDPSAEAETLDGASPMDDGVISPTEGRDMGPLTVLDVAHRDVQLTAERRKQYEFSPVLLWFTEPEAESRAADFAAEFDAKAVPVVSLCLAAILGTGLVISIVQSLVPESVIAHHDLDISPAGVVLLAIPCLGFAARGVLFVLYPRCFTESHTAAKKIIDATLTSAFLLSAAASTYFFDITIFASVPSFFVFLMAVMPHMYQHTNTWLVTAAVQFVFGQLAPIVSRMWLHQEFKRRVSSSYAVLAAAILLGVVTQYLSRRRVKEHYATGALAADLATLSHQNAEMESSLLHALLPRHAAFIAVSMTHTADYQRMLEKASLSVGSSTVYSPHALNHWGGIVVLRGRYVRPAGHGVGGDVPVVPWADDAADRWANLVAMVAAVCPNGELEIVEGFGDDFTVAGPFQRNNEAAPADVTPAPKPATFAPSPLREEGSGSAETPSHVSFFSPQSATSRYAASQNQSSFAGTGGAAGALLPQVHPAAPVHHANHGHHQHHRQVRMATNAPPTSRSAVAAVALLRELQNTVGFPGVQAAVTVGTAFSALLGGQLLSYRLFGPSVREAATVLEAGLLPAGSAVFATPAFRRAHRGAFVTAPIPPPMPAMPAPTNAAEAIAAMHMSLSRAYAGSIMLQKTALPVASDVPPEGDATFGAPMRWRLKAAGVMMVSTVRL